MAELSLTEMDYEVLEWLNGTGPKPVFVAAANACYEDLRHFGYITNNQKLTYKGVMALEKRETLTSSAPPTPSSVFMETYSSGATRTSEANKLDYKGFLSPFALKRFAEYMDHHRLQADGTLRDSDNWKMGMDQKRAKRSLVRHCMDFWRADESGEGGVWEKQPDGSKKWVTSEDLLCAVMFNVVVLLHEKCKPGEGTSSPEASGPASSVSPTSTTAVGDPKLPPLD